MKFLIYALLIPFLYSCLHSQESKSVNPYLYPVHAEIKEVKNRTLECTVRNHKIIVDQPQKFGADDLGPTPPELLAMSYGSCISSTIQFLAYQKNIKISDIKVIVDGEIDFSKAMGKETDNPPGFISLKVKIEFTSNLSKEEKKKFIDEVFSKGAVIDNIRNKTKLEIEII